ncbi:MAG: hypothetical protein J6Z08_05100 [Elusimicrobiales bacterium]|nr:hypothetical protein [Elusimicrobiales bacterium]
MMNPEELKNKASGTFKCIKERTAGFLVNFFSDRKNLKSLLFTLLYAIVTFILLSHHEIWADEAHVWMQLKYKSLADLFRYSMGEGHPFLFYALMFPFVKAGFSMSFIRIFCWLSSSVGIFFFLRCAPFSAILKATVLLSAPFLYFFPVHARNYSLVPLFMFSAGALYSRRREYPLLYLILLLGLASSHFLVTLPAFYLVGCFFYEISGNTPVRLLKKFFIPALAVSLFLYIQADSAFHGNIFYNISLKGNFETVVLFLKSFFSCFTDYFVSETYMVLESSFLYLLCVFISFLLATLFFVLFYRSGRYFAGSVLTLASHFFIYFFVYPVVYPVRAYCFSSLLLFFFWLASADGKKSVADGSINSKNTVTPDSSVTAESRMLRFRSMISRNNRKISEILLSVLFTMSVPTGLHMAFMDYTGPFSSAPEMAEFIRTHISHKDIVLSATDFIEGLLYYTQDRDIGYKSINSLHFAVNSGDHDYEEADIIPYVKAGRRVYLVFNWYADFDEKIYPVFHTQEAIKNRESFTIVQLLSDRNIPGPMPAVGMTGTDPGTSNVEEKDPFFHQKPYFWP